MRPDLIREWTEELARDPGSLVFIRLADQLRRDRQLDDARRVALRGLERHPYSADAHDMLARICADAGSDGAAREEWETALSLDAGHAGALKGLAFLAWRRRDWSAAERLLATALRSAPSDEGLAAAHAQVRDALRATTQPTDSPRPEGSADPAPANAGPRGAGKDRVDSRALFALMLGDGDRTALLLDRDGLVLAGTYVGADGREVSEEIGAHLAGLAEEADRALGQLGLGAWEALLVEASHATVAMGPAVDGSVVLVAAARDTQVGLVRRLLDRAGRRAASWLEGMA